MGESLFFLMVTYAPLSNEFETLLIVTFNEISDPQNHLDAFNNLMELYQVSKLAWYRCPTVTLVGEAKKWFKSYPLAISLHRSNYLYNSYNNSKWPDNSLY